MYNKREEFRLLVGEITDALNVREFEIHIRSDKEVQTDEDVDRFFKRAGKTNKTPDT